MSSVVAGLLTAQPIRCDPQHGRFTASFQARRDFCNLIGSVQGGMLTAMLDLAMSFAVLCSLEDGHVVAVSGEQQRRTQADNSGAGNHDPGDGDRPLPRPRMPRAYVRLRAVHQPRRRLSGGNHLAARLRVTILGYRQAQVAAERLRLVPGAVDAHLLQDRHDVAREPAEREEAAAPEALADTLTKGRTVPAVTAKPV